MEFLLASVPRSSRLQVNLGKTASGRQRCGGLIRWAAHLLSLEPQMSLLPCPP